MTALLRPDVDFKHGTIFIRCVMGKMEGAAPQPLKESGWADVVDNITYTAAKKGKSLCERGKKAEHRRHRDMGDITSPIHFSIVVPVYKAEKYLAHCVQSVLAQTYQEFDAVLVDDGSPDNCPVICDTYAAQDSRLHVIHKENGGALSARCAAIDYACDVLSYDRHYLLFLDADDTFKDKVY